MTTNYDLFFTKKFQRQFKRIAKKNSLLRAQIYLTLELLKKNPFHSTLKSHRVTGRLIGESFSFSVNRDIRILWDYAKGRVKALDILDLGGHSGSHKVYK